MSELKPYVGTKIIKAKSMSRFDYLSTIQNQDIPTGIEDEPGYLVVYPPDDYRSWSPKAVFDIAYREITKAEKEVVVAAF